MLFLINFSYFESKYIFNNKEMKNEIITLEKNHILEYCSVILKDIAAKTTTKKLKKINL